MTTAMTTNGHAAEYDNEKRALIKQTVAQDANDLELEFFLYNAQRFGLDPLARQIYFIKRKNKGTIQTGIDGFRLIADRTGAYAGNDDPVFTYDDSPFPVSATVTVWKIVQGQRCPFTATALWAEYKPDQDHMWRKMPHTMLAKCSEALALRKAFPANLSGLYAHEEMAQAGGNEPPGVVVDAEPADELFTDNRNSPPSAPTIDPDDLHEQWVTTCFDLLVEGHRVGVDVPQLRKGDIRKLTTPEISSAVQKLQKQILAATEGVVQP